MKGTGNLSSGRSGGAHAESAMMSWRGLLCGVQLQLLDARMNCQYQITLAKAILSRSFVVIGRREGGASRRSPFGWFERPGKPAKRIEAVQEPSRSDALKRKRREGHAGDRGRQCDLGRVRPREPLLGGLPLDVQEGNVPM